MITEVEDRGVEINGRFIPAVNIQVEGFPGMVTYADGSKIWYGIYFEIMFEDGALWIVGQGADNYVPDHIGAVMFDGWAQGDSRLEEARGQTFETWDAFLETYDFYVKNYLHREG